MPVVVSDACARHPFHAGWWHANLFDGADLRRVLGVFLFGHWVSCGLLSVFFVVMCRESPMQLLLHLGVLAALAVVLAPIQFLYSTGRGLRWWFLSFLCLMDLVGLSAGLAAGGLFDSDYVHLFYFPVVGLGGLALCTVRANLGWCALVAGSYVALCVFTGDGVALASRDGQVLLARVLVMGFVGLVATSSCVLERFRWRDALYRERFLLDERARMSRSVHDTAAQIAYVLSLGLESLVSSADRTGSALSAQIRANARLAREMVWQLRQLVNGGGIYEGQSLRSAVHFHSVSFTDATSVPVDFTCSGTEPDLSVRAKRVLFLAFHNLMTNAYRHSGAGRVTVELLYLPSSVCLSVSDDGCGLPLDYACRGHGFRNMGADLSRVGGVLVVERSGSFGGATVRCEVPLSVQSGGDHGT